MRARRARLLHGRIAVGFLRSRRLHQGRRGFAVAQCEQLQRWGEPQVGTRGVVRADYSFRDYNDFYSLRTDQSTGAVADEFGNRADLTLVENTDALKRRYSGVTVSGTYNVNGRTQFGGNYTLSRLWGNSKAKTWGPARCRPMLPVPGISAIGLVRAGRRFGAGSAASRNAVAQLRRSRSKV